MSDALPYLYAAYAVSVLTLLSYALRLLVRARRLRAELRAREAPPGGPSTGAS